MNKLLLVLAVVSMASVSVCGAEGLGTLIEVGRSQAEIQKQYARETRSFNDVKKAIEAGAIKKGQTKEFILDRYGEPVVRTCSLDGKYENWIYKPAESSFFEGIRATLIFDLRGILEEVKVEER